MDLTLSKEVLETTSEDIEGLRSKLVSELEQVIEMILPKVVDSKILLSHDQSVSIRQYINSIGRIDGQVVVCSWTSEHKEKIGNLTIEEISNITFPIIEIAGKALGKEIVYNKSEQIKESQNEKATESKESEE